MTESGTVANPTESKRQKGSRVSLRGVRVDRTGGQRPRAALTLSARLPLHPRQAAPAPPPHPPPPPPPAHQIIMNRLVWRV